MKKIFRMALVFALAGATLMYTGCSKDYSEDINRLDDQISALKNDLSQNVSSLSGQVTSLQTALSNLESAYKAADDAIKKDVSANKADIATLKGQMSDAEDAIDQIKTDLANYAKKSELDDAKKALEEKITNAVAKAEKDLADIKDELLKKADELKDDLDAAKEDIADLQKFQEAQEALNAAYDALGTELRAIVFIPDLYYAGIEATEYSYAVLYPYAIAPLTAEYSFDVDKNPQPVKYSFPKDAKALLASAAPWADAKSYSIGENAIANYNLNPSAFDVKNAEWKLNGYDKKYVVKGEDEPVAPETWAVKFDGIKNNNGVGEVSYHIENPMLLNGLVETYFDSIMDYIFGGLDLTAKENIMDYIVSELGKINGTVSIMNLEAKIGEKVIASDYEAIVSDYEMLEALAFAKNNTLTAAPNPCIINQPTREKHLYLYADNAVKAAADAPSIPVYYNCGQYDLKSLVNIHVLDSEGGYEATLADLQEKYGENITMNFELVPYTIGKNVTQESAYGFIEDGVFFPAYVKDIEDAESGKPYTSVKCGTDGKGISSVGRLPLVLVTLWDGDKMLLHGYFVIEITEEIIDPTKVATIIPLKDFGKFPYICAEQQGETFWYEYSDNVLEELGMTYAKMLDKYQVMNDQGNLVNIVPGGEYSLKAFVLKDGQYVAPEKSLGTVYYHVDASGNGINDKFTWTFDKADLDNFANPQDIYILFQAGEYELVYFKFSANVAAKPHLTIGKKINADWNADVYGEPKNTVTINVKVPNANETTPVIGGDVKEFYKVIDETFYSDDPDVDAPVVSFDAANSDPIYAEVAVEGHHKYVFNASQDAFQGYQFFVNADASELWAEKAVAGKAYANYKTTDAGAEKIASIVDPEIGKIQYNNDSDLAKLLLNMKGWEETETANMLYAKVDIQLSYGNADDCEIPTDVVSFYSRFIRPLKIEFGAQKISAESEFDGDNVRLIDFLSSIKDWQNKDVIKVTEVEGVKVYAPNVEKTIDVYKYYGFDTMTVDLGKTQINNWDLNDPAAFGDLSQYRQEATIELGTLNANGTFTAGHPKATNNGDGTYTIDIKDFDTIKDLVINYRNGRVVSEPFVLLINGGVNYAWGTYEGVFEIDVNETGNL